MNTELRQDGTVFTLPITEGKMVQFDTKAVGDGWMRRIVKIHLPGGSTIQPPEPMGFATDRDKPHRGVEIWGLNEDGTPHNFWRCAPYALPLKLQRHV